MRFFLPFALVACMALTASAARAQALPSVPDTAKSDAAKPASSGALEVTADQSLEWYEDQHMYVARGNAKAVRGDLTIEADLLSAHEREKPEAAAGDKKTGDKAAKVKKPKDPNAKNNEAGDIDRMTADGNVRIIKPKQLVTGDHAVYDLDKHVMVVTGNNLKYQTDKETVTAKDSLEYWEDKKIAVARGHAVADKGDRHVTGDVLTAEFRDLPDGGTEMEKLTAIGHVTVITKGDVSRGDEAVYDTVHNLAVLTGNVQITRSDGMQLSGDMGEVDFNTNQSRLLNQGKGRVRALLPSHDKPAAKTSGKVKPVEAASQ